MPIEGDGEKIFKVKIGMSGVGRRGVVKSRVGCLGCEEKQLFIAQGCSFVGDCGNKNNCLQPAKSVRCGYQEGK